MGSLVSGVVFEHDLLHVERLELLVPSALAGIDEVGDPLALLLVLGATVKCHELLESQEAATNTNHDGLTFNLHKDLLPSESVNTRCLPFKVKLATESQRCFIDVAGKVLIDWVISLRLVKEEFVFDGALHVFHL